MLPATKTNGITKIIPFKSIFILILYQFIIFNIFNIYKFTLCKIDVHVCKILKLNIIRAFSIILVYHTPLNTYLYSLLGSKILNYITNLKKLNLSTIEYRNIMHIN